MIRGPWDNWHLCILNFLDHFVILGSTFAPVENFVAIKLRSLDSCNAEGGPQPGCWTEGKNSLAQNVQGWIVG